MNIEKVNNFIEYESKMLKLFGSLGLKPNHCQLIRALIIVSGGNVEFEASFKDLQKLAKGDKGNTSTIRYALKSLLKWQDKNNIEIVRVLTHGKRIQNQDGTFEYQKTKFRMRLIDEIDDIYQADPDNFEKEVLQLINNLKSESVQTHLRNSYHPLHNFRKAKNTIKTKLVRVYEYANQAGLNPEMEFERIVKDAKAELVKIQEIEKFKKNRTDFINSFEAKVYRRETTDDLFEEVLN